MNDWWKALALALGWLAWIALVSGATFWLVSKVGIEDSVVTVPAVIAAVLLVFAGLFTGLRIVVSKWF